MVWVANSYSCGDLGLPGFCPVELCTVVLSADKVATGTLHDVYLKQTVRLRIDGYEPGGREFESLRAHHLIKQQVSEGFTCLSYMFFCPSFSSSHENNGLRVT